MDELRALHQLIDTIAATRPDCIEAIFLFLKAVTDDDEPGPDAAVQELTPLTPADCVT
jgi:hypothetical protein